MTEAVMLDFAGPFAWLPGLDLPCLFEAEVASRPGIYLWTIATPDGDLVYYVGETGRAFATRLEEHLRDQLSGRYRIYDPLSFAAGTKKLLWGGLVGRLKEPSVTAFASRLDEFAAPLSRFVKLVRFLLAPLECEPALRRRVEAALADHFYRQEGLVGEFQDDDIYYDRTPVSSEPFDVRCQWPVEVRGAPNHLRVGDTRAGHGITTM